MIGILSRFKAKREPAAGEPIDSARYEPAYSGKDAEVSLLAATMRHLDGIPWWKADLPPVKHECWAQTMALDERYAVDRCACGAIAMRGPFESRRVWADKNRTRRDRKRMARP